MLEGQVTFVKAAKDFFENGQYGRKVAIEEFKALSPTDKEELRNLLIELGYDVAPLGTQPSAL